MRVRIDGRITIKDLSYGLRRLATPLRPLDTDGGIGGFRVFCARSALAVETSSVALGQLADGAFGACGRSEAEALRWSNWWLGRAGNGVLGSLETEAGTKALGLQKPKAGSLVWLVSRVGRKRGVVIAGGGSWKWGAGLAGGWGGRRGVWVVGE